MQQNGRYFFWFTLHFFLLESVFHFIILGYFESIISIGLTFKAEMAIFVPSTQ
jgi:hypothetical protein